MTHFTQTKRKRNIFIGSLCIFVVCLTTACGGTARGDTQMLNKSSSITTQATVHEEAETTIQPTGVRRGELYWSYLYYEGQLYTYCTHSGFGTPDGYSQYDEHPYKFTEGGAIDDVIKSLELSQVGQVQAENPDAVPAVELHSANIPVGTIIYSGTSADTEVYVLHKDLGEERLTLYVPVTFDIEKEDTIYRTKDTND